MATLTWGELEGYLSTLTPEEKLQEVVIVDMDNDIICFPNVVTHALETILSLNSSVIYESDMEDDECVEDSNIDIPKGSVILMAD